MIVGGAGFARALDDRHLLLAGTLGAEDPLAGGFDSPGGRIGILALESNTRRRIRVNGVGHRTQDGILVTVDQAFGNCPKFIQRRLPGETLTPPSTPRHRTTGSLDEGQAGLVRAADTFFIASAHPERGADASHRGGRPGFVEVSGDGRGLQFPDYAGNGMFQTLGNIAVDPRVGLLFLDWEAGTSLQLTGHARIVWDDDETSTRPGAERLVDVEIDEVHQQDRAMPSRWSLIERWRRNPPVRGEYDSEMQIEER